MCGRYALDADPVRFAEYFQITGELDFKPSWNIAPSSPIFTITADEQAKRHLRLMRWGLIPSWAKDPALGNNLINARGESVVDKPSFRSAFKTRRCLIPASGFYEWKVDNGKKFPWYISLKSGEPMAFAGLWETWQPAAGATIESCCIITTSANALIQPIHDRMPVILDAAHWDTWLSPNIRQADHLLPMIRPYVADSIQAWPVSRDINKTGKRDDISLIDKIG
jgi:putative SOS response-associated peptidase YedK